MKPRIKGLAWAGVVYFVVMFNVLQHAQGPAVNTGGGSGGGALTIIATTFSATPTYTCTSTTGSTLFTITLTGNVTSSTLSGCGSSQKIGFAITQDGTGNRTHAFPTGFSNVTAIGASANYTTTEWFSWNGSAASPSGSAMVYTGSILSILSNAGSSTNPSIAVGPDQRGFYYSGGVIVSSINGAANAAFTSGGFMADANNSPRIGISNTAGGAAGGVFDANFWRVAAGVFGTGKTGSANDGWLQESCMQRNTADVTNATATLATITGLSCTVTAGRTYGFDVNVLLTSDTLDGVQLAVGGTATATAIQYNGLLFNGTTLAADTTQTSLGGVVCALTATTASRCNITGTITVNAGGTLLIQFAQNANTNANVTTATRGARLRGEDYP